MLRDPEIEHRDAKRVDSAVGHARADRREGRELGGRGVALRGELRAPGGGPEAREEHALREKGVAEQEVVGDLVLLVDVYHHIEMREKYFRRLAASLKPGGRLAVIDYRLDAPNGPPKASRIAPQRVKAELRRAGYLLQEEHGFLPRQYFLVFGRPTG